MKKHFIFVFLFIILFSSAVRASDYRSREIKYQYNVLKQDLTREQSKKIYDRYPSGYMTKDEYEKASEYKDKSQEKYSVPEIVTPSDFKYIPKPIYSIVKYNDPAGSKELTLGKRLFALKQINAQGIVSPDYSKLVYPAVYYYGDNATVDCDLFVIPLDEGDSNLEKILKANVAKREFEPIMSTDKNIDNFAAFRTLTPVDFSSDGSKLLVKEKIGSSEDGIWETDIFLYDFDNKTKYDLNDLRHTISYFWKEYMKVNLDANRWDIVPLGFLKKNNERVAVQAYAYTGEVPVYLGAWSIGVHGEKPILISFDTNYIVDIEANGFKIIRQGTQDYQTTKREEKFQKQQTKVIKKQFKKADKDSVKEIKDEYKYKFKDLKEDYKYDAKNYRKLRSLSGSTSGTELEAAYEQYLKDELNKNIEKTKKQIDKQQKKLDDIDEKLQKMTN